LNRATSAPWLQQAKSIIFPNEICLFFPAEKSRKNLTKQNDYIKNRSSLALLAGNDGRATVGCVLGGEDE